MLHEDPGSSRAASAVALVGTCSYCIATGLLLAEVTLLAMRRRGADAGAADVVLRDTLGGTGSAAASLGLVGLQWALLVACVRARAALTRWLL